MKLLIVAATKAEASFLTKKYNFPLSENHLTTFNVKNNKIGLLITGIGIHSTTYHLTRILHTQEYNFVLNIGIAGSLEKFAVGDVVNIIQDEFADFGIEKKETFSTLFDEGLIRKTEFPFIDGRLLPNFIEFSDIIAELPEAKGITVNSVHGSQRSIEKIKSKFDAEIETMEGAAVFFVCLNENISCTQIRAISNIVEPRDEAKWNIPKAMESLEKVVVNLLEEIC